MLPVPGINIDFDTNEPMCAISSLLPSLKFVDSVTIYTAYVGHD